LRNSNKRLIYRRKLQIAFESYQENLVQAGVSEWENRLWTDAHYGFTYSREPLVSVVTSVVEAVLGRKPLDPSVLIQQLARFSLFHPTVAVS
jgi:hypothetical protein